jgi:quercetin dioxygenase-like cupin family protein
MRHTVYFAALLAVLLCSRAGPSAEPRGPRKAALSVHAAQDLKWKDGPPSLPPGAQMVVLEGDPAKAGPFVFRIKAPDGYRVPPHTHTRPERITVLSGTFYVGMGGKFDASAGREMPAGAYGTWPAGMKHFVWTKGETVLQFHGEGPWTIRYVNPADDPRNKKK